MPCVEPMFVDTRCVIGGGREEEVMLRSPSSILLLVAVVLFLLAAFDVNLGKLNLVTLGFAAFAGSFLLAGWRR